MAGTGEDDELAAIWNDAPPRRVVPAVRTARMSIAWAPARSDEDENDSGSSTSKDSYFVESENDSEDSAIRRRREAELKIRDFGEAATTSAAAGAEHTEHAAQAPPPPAPLPGADSVFADVDGPPAFLDPEATRPLADAIHRKRQRDAASEAALRQAAKAGAGPGSSKAQKGNWDISRMAPKLKSEGQAQEKGVISAAPVRYKTEDRVGVISAAAVAMLGGTLREDGEGMGGEGEEEEQSIGGRYAARRATVGPASGPPRPAGAMPVGGKRTGPMPVDKFLEKGLGGAALPRARQERKDKEKQKRMKGQSTHAEWKSEAEMALRQQYD